MNKPDKQRGEPEKKETSTEKDPAQQGREAIEMQKKISGKPKEQTDREDKEDAEKWRNEG